MKKQRVLFLRAVLLLSIMVLLVPNLRAGIVTYTYDSLNRLTSAMYYSDDGNFTILNYQYDATGNIISYSVSQDVDTDEDGLPDTLEDKGCTNPDDADSDDDGITDGDEDVNKNGIVDAGETDPCDRDTDGDGIQDGTELGYTISDIGADTDTSVFQPDLDQTTTTDPLNSDSDNDGWDDGEEDANHNGLVDLGESDPNDDTLPTPTPPEVMETIPHANAGIDDSTRVSNNTSFAVRLKDSDGIDIADTSSVRFSIDDGTNSYERDLSDTTTVRVIKLTSDPDTAVTSLWAVYDRSSETAYENYYPYDTSVNIEVSAKDRRGAWITQASYDFKVETETEHNDAQDNLPDTSPLDADDSDLGGHYDAGVQVNSGDLEGAKIVFDSGEPVTPTFGPTNEIPALDVEDADAVGVPVNLQPPTVFNTPVKIFIPCPNHIDVSFLSVYLYNGTSWVLACNASGVQPGGEGCIVPDSWVNHNNGNPSTIEIQVYHFSGFQSGIYKSIPCFVSTVVLGSFMAPSVNVLREFRDRFLLTSRAGSEFVNFYYTCSPLLTEFVTPHDALKTVVRYSLLPIIGVSWIIIHIGPAAALLFVILLLAVTSFTATRLVLAWRTQNTQR